MKPIRIGVLALQGSFAEHGAIFNTKLAQLDNRPIEAVQVRTEVQLHSVDGLIIPGGESTAIGKLLLSTHLDKAISKRSKHGMPIYGTCAGCILIANEVDSAYSLKLVDITVRRNAFGRQQDSFQTTLHSQTLPDTTGVFIRAPQISAVGPNVQILYALNNQPVLIQQNNILAGTFHPELTDDYTIHRYFAQLVAKATDN